MSPISAPNATLPSSAGSRPGLPLPGRPWLLPSALLGAVVGAALQLQQAALWTLSAYAALMGLGLVLGAAAWAGARCSPVARWARWCITLSPGLALAAGALLMSGMTGGRAVAYLQQALAPALEGQDLRITGVVAAMPQSNEAGMRWRMAVEAATQQGQPVSVPPQIDVAWYGGVSRDAGDMVELQRLPAPVRAGERWQMTVRLKAPHGLRNPHGFDYELWMWEQGVQATGYVRAGPRDEPPMRLAVTWRHPVEQLRQAVRDAILERLVHGADDPSNAARMRTAGVVTALVTGDQRAIDRADWEVFRATGVAHLMSISGLHITLFAWLAAMAVRALWRRWPGGCLVVPAPSAALVAGVLLATGYALFSGWGVPAQRTVTMLAIVALLRLSGRRWPWPQGWLLACAAVVVVDPWALVQAGFWLSFVAVGVLFATNPIADQAYGTGAIGRFQAMVREQWVVTLALTPLGLLLFGQVSLVGFVANLVAIPWVTLVVTPLALGGMLWGPLWSMAALSLQPFTALLQWLAQWPWATVFLPAAPLWAGVVAVAGGLLLAMPLPVRLRVLALPLLIPVLWWPPQRPPVGQFELLAADIGQGNAVLVRTAQHTLLYDAGPRFSRESDAGHRVLVPLLRALGERVDVLMLSHRDTDHTGGAAAVLAQQPQAEVTGSIEDEHALWLGRASQPCLAGQRWEWDGVTLEVLHPLPGDHVQSPKPPRPNALSCVLRITASGGQGASALLVGDIEAAQEQALVARGAPLSSDWLLVPHHGSKTSSSAAFLEAVQPRTAWVQAGYRNRFGHPAAEVLQRYRARGIAVIESSRCGAAQWTSLQPARVDCERDTGQRYWQHRMVPRDD